MQVTEKFLIAEDMPLVRPPLFCALRVERSGKDRRLFYYGWIVGRQECGVDAAAKREKLDLPR